MAAQVQQSTFFKKHAAEIKKTVETNVKEGVKVNSGFVKVIAGITNGIAEVTVCRFEQDENNPGREFFRMSGTVISPSYVGPAGNQISTEGMQTVKFVALDPQDVPASIKNVMQVMAEGGMVFEGPGPFDLPSIAVLLEKTKPQFRFDTQVRKQQIDETTGKPKLNPKTNEPYPEGVWENWRGPVKHKVTRPSANGDTHTNGSGTVTSDPIKGRNTLVQSEFGSAKEDLGSILSRARKDDTGAADQLRILCAELNYDDSDFDSNGWDEIEGWLRKGEPKEEPTSLLTPSVDDTCKFSPPNPKKPGQRLKEIDCGVKEVDEDNQTCTLYEFANPKKTYQNVKWADDNVKWGA